MNNSDVIQLSELLRHVLRHKWMLISCVVAGVILGLLLSFVVPKKYESETLLMPAAQDSRAPQLPSELLSLGSLAGINLGGSGAEKAEAIAILESRQFARGFIHDHDLLPVLFRNDWDEDAKMWKEEIPPTMFDAVSRFRNDVYVVRRVPNSDMVRLSVVWTDPSVAAEWVFELVTRLNGSLRTRAMQKADKNISFLEQQLENTSNVELRQAIYRLIEDQVRGKMLANVQDEYAFVTIDPPVVADLDNFVAPNRALYTIGGVLIGLLVGFLLLIFLSARQSQDQ